jgi:glycosyltransferase involved in cell wall biosynthesis
MAGAGTAVVRAGADARAPAPRLRFERPAVAHHWLVARRGGERVLDALLALLPGAPVYTLVHDPARCPAPAGARAVHASPLQRLPLAPRAFRVALPFHARAFAAFDLAGHDLLLSSDAALAKAVRAPPGAPHLCYCYSPPRWAHDLRDDYLAALPPPLRPAARRLLTRVADQDRAAARAVTAFVAPSRHVAARIARAYEREAQVVPPPVDTAFFTPGDPSPDLGPLAAPLQALAPGRRPWLVLGHAAPYKRMDVAVRAARARGEPLVLAGDGPGFTRLARLAGPRALVLRAPSDRQVRGLLRAARALLFPGEEDFGLLPVEAMACGRPVVALARGGAVETVLDSVTGVLYPAAAGAEVPALAAALDRFTALEDGLHADEAVARAAAFAPRVFHARMHALLAAL